MINDKQLQGLKIEIQTKGYLDREELLKFLTLIPTNDAQVIIQETKNWLQSLHNDPDLPNLILPEDEINAILGDLDSYGRVQPLTIQQFKQSSIKAIPQTQ